MDSGIAETEAALPEFLILQYINGIYRKSYKLLE
jgi:hypothetical protein